MNKRWWLPWLQAFDPADSAPRIFFLKFQMDFLSCFCPSLMWVRAEQDCKVGNHVSRALSLLLAISVYAMADPPAASVKT